MDYAPSRGFSHSQQGMSTKPPSGLTSYYAKPSTVAVPAFDGRGKKVLIFSSEWYFRPEGVKIVKKGFEKALAVNDLAAHVEWNDDNHTFRIICFSKEHNKIWGSFLVVVDDLIKKSVGDGWDTDNESDFEDLDEDRQVKNDFIQRLSAWKKEKGIASDNDVDLNDNQQEEVSGSIEQIPCPDFPENIRFYKGKAIWEHVDTKPSLDEIVPDEVLLKLASLNQLNGCKFIKDLNQGKIYIGSSSEEQCCIALSKLENIRKNTVLKLPYVKNLFYTEEFGNYQVSFNYFVDIKKKFFENTLLDNLQWSPKPDEKYSKLPFAATVRCSIFHQPTSCFVPFKVGKFTPAVDVNDTNSGAREWENYRYNPYILEEYKEENSMIRYQKYKELEHQRQAQAAQQSHTTAEISKMKPAPVESPNRSDIIQRWATQVHPKPVTERPNKILNSLETSDSLGQPQASRKNANWDTYNQYNPEKDFNLHQKPKYTLVNATMAGLKKLRSMQVSESTPRLSESAPIPQPQINQNFGNYHIIPPEVANSFPDFFKESPPKNMVPTLPALRPVPRPSQDMISFTDESAEQYSLQEPLPKMTAPMSLNQEFEDLMSFDECLGHPFDENISVLDFDVLQPTGPTRGSCLETTQRIRESEVATRTYHSTMSQKAPKPKKKSQKSNNATKYSAQLPVPSPPRPHQLTAPTKETIDPLPEFMIELDSSFSTLIHGLRGFQGEVMVQAEIGRLLLKGIHPKYITCRDSERSQNPDTLLNILQPLAGHIPKTFFTNVVTILPADITHLVEIKDRKGNAIWEPNQSMRGVLYEFVCLDRRERRYNPFIVEIDSDNFDLGPKVKIKSDLGSINVHGTKRYWDFRIAATGIQKLEKDHAYEELSSAIMKTLYIPGGSSHPLAYFEIDNSLSHFDVLGVRVRRTSQYNSQGEKSILKVSEVIELDLDYVQGDGSIIGKAIGAAAPRTGLNWLDSWYEVSISCAKADQMFEENKSLELGDEVPWSPDKLSEIGAAQAIYLPACEMIKQMDGIGFYNDNGFGIPEGIAPTNLEAESDKATYFW